MTAFFHFDGQMLGNRVAKSFPVVWEAYFLQRGYNERKLSVPSDTANNSRRTTVGTRAPTAFLVNKIDRVYLRRAFAEFPNCVQLYGLHRARSVPVSFIRRAYLHPRMRRSSNIPDHVQ